jgi:hypothetical protein
MAMAKKSAKASKAKLVAKFKHPMTVEIIVPSFVPLAAASTLDVQKLSKGSHTIEVGFLEGGCCPKMVRAVIRNGMVTRLDVAPCEDSEQLLPKEMSRDIAAIVAKAKKLAVKNPWKPVPVREFVGNIARLNDSYPPRAGTGAGCFYICVWHYCIFCCYWNFPFFCWIERRKPDVEM